MYNALEKNNVLHMGVAQHLCLSIVKQKNK